jgi:mono/diheme cytochrome c family protein
MPFMKRSSALILFALSILMLSGCAVSLASDITPPPNAESYSAQDTPAATDSVYPIVPPDPQAGAAIFTEKCAPCHGGLGLGDGPQSGKLPVPVPALGDPALAVAARPVDWYNMVTNGNLERYMPGFTSLDDRQRWDVVSYALTLSLSGSAAASGKEIYSANCESCHGEQGTGGLNAPNWQKESGRLAQLSLDEIAAVTESGIGDMPGFGGGLTADELNGVAQYVRLLSFSAQSVTAAVTPAPTTTESSAEALTTSIPVGSAEPLPQPNLPDSEATPAGTPEAAVPAELTITGKITVADGIKIPDNLSVTLAGFDSLNQVYQAETEVESDGSFEFNNVEFISGRAFIATVDYQGLTFSSDVYHSTETQPGAVVELTIPYYETTSDSSALRADRLHLFFDFTQTEVVQVVELFILNNTGDKAIVSADGQGTVAFDLPQGATNLQFQDSVLGERYIQTEKGFADSASILPGGGTQILFAYDLPYSRKTTLSIPIPMEVDAAVIMLPVGSVKLTSDQLQSTGTRQVQGIDLDMFTASGLQAGSTLEMTLSGRISTGVNVETGSSTGLLIGGGVLGVVLVGAGFWMWRQRKRSVEEAEIAEGPGEENPDEIMDAIIALDDSFQSGSLSEEAYQKRRAELKEKLQTLAK